MNKYQKALEWHEEHSTFNQYNIYESQLASETLQELVDKETPMKPNRHGRYCGRCDIKRLIKGDDKYCSVCGQKIDWSEDDEQ